MVIELAGTGGGMVTGAGAALVEAALRGELAVAVLGGELAMTGGADTAVSRVCPGSGAGRLHATNAIRIELAPALRRILMACRGLKNAAPTPPIPKEIGG